ncbi:unnamed protein product [Notodromas monacha]|uniref:Adenomatous polyposis coli protein n=1 Tax=Notodromas monacha TaxID=399045 RepID=A0A7R9BMF4_9CRUS|nr:unnamed protein product [Notodromas monacha]CAG0918192.1 unnamed protein product [Notodromas monacha]
MSTKAEMVYHLLTLLGHQEPQHMSQTLLTMSQSPHNCSTMRHSGRLATLLVEPQHMSQTLLTMSQSPHNCSTMRHSGRLFGTAHPVDPRGPDGVEAAELDSSWLGQSPGGVIAVATRFSPVACVPSSSSVPKRVRTLISPDTAFRGVRTGLVQQCRRFQSRKMSADSNNDSQPGPAMATLMKLSFDEDHRHAMTGLGGLQAIAELMEVDHLAHGIIGLSSSGGAVTQSYSSTSSDGQQVCVTLRRYAGMALTNLTFGDSGNKATLCSYRGFMLALVAQLQSCSEDLRQVTASVLRNLSWRADVNSKQVLREVGSVSKLMTAAIEANRESTLKSILSALWNLSAHCSANKAEICATPGALEFLVDTLSYEAASKTLAVVENAGGILRNVSSHVAVRDDYRRVLRDRHCLEVLLGHLRSPSLTVVSNACGTLWNLSARSGEDQATLWALGAPQMLKSLVHSKHRMIAMGSSAALKNLMSARPAGMESSLEGSLGSPVSESGFTPPPPPRLQARKQKVTPESLVSQNLAETCENLDQNLHSPMSPGHPMSSWSQLDCGKPPGYHVAWRPTPSHAPPPQQQQPQQQPPQIQLQHSQTSRCFVERSDSRDSVHSIRSDSFCDRWNRHPVVETSVRNNMPQALDLSCRSRSQDPLSQYAVKDTNPLKSVNNNNSGGSIKQPQSNPANSVNNNMTEMEFAARVNEISQSLAHHQIDDCFSSPKHKTDASSPPPDCKGDGSGVYAETDLDNPELPVDYSLIYAEEDDETKFKQAKSGSPPKSAKQQYYESSFHDDAVRTYCTEGTPYSQTPYLVSNAGSLTDLTAVCEDANAGIRGAGKRGLSVSGKVEQAQQQKGNGDHANADKPKTYCVEDTPLEMSHAGSLSSITGTASDCGAPGGGVPNNGVVLREKSGLSRGSGTTRNANSVPVHQQQEQSEPTSSRSSLGVDPRRQSEHMMSETSDLGTSDSAATLTAGAEDAIDEGAVTPSLHKAGKTVTFCAKEEETPLMFSRASSLDSLSSTDQHSIRSSVVSDFSRRTSGVVSPSELPDSPGGTMPPSPNRLKPNPRAFESGGDTDATGAPRGDSGSSPAGATSSSSSTANGRREGKPRSRVSSGGKGGEKRKHENNRLSGDMGAFADETRSYAVEGTPFLQSHATSLSSLVNFDDEDEEQEGVVLQPCANQDSSKAKITPPVSKLPKTSKPVGVVEPTSKSMQKNHSPAASTTSSKSNLQSESKINCPAVAKVEPQRRTIVDATETPPEYVTVFATEDTPANISHAGSTGNLSNLSFPSEPSFTHRLKQNGANEGNAGSKSPLGNQPGSDSSYKSSRSAGKKAPLSPERKKEEPKRLVACDDEDGDDDDVLLQCIQSAMPKKKAPAVAGSGGGAMSTTTAKSSSGRTSSREKSSSRRSPSKTS